MDQAFEGRQRKKAAQLSLVAAIIIFAIKIVAYRMTGSQAIFSEAMETIVNVLAASLALFVIYYAAKPADKEHPYGHGKAESLSAAVEGGLISFAAFIIIFEAIQAFYENRPVLSLNIGLMLIAATGVINLLVGVYLIKVGEKQKSSALKASGHHLMADFWTSAGVIVGLGLVLLTGIIWIDRVIALLVSLHLIKEGFALIRESIGVLLDEKEPEVLEELKNLINQHNQEGIIQVHHLRVMRSGNYHHIDAHVVVPEFWTVEGAHDRVREYDQLIFKHYDYSGEVHFHTDPCRRLYCRYCDLSNCPVRQEAFVEKRKMTLSEMTAEDEPQEVIQAADKMTKSDF